MTRPGAVPAAWPGLLEPAAGYALAVVQAITPEVLPRPTPCAGWDVRMLLRHASESLVALHEGIDAGRVGLRPAPDDPAGDPAQVFRDRAGLLLTAWAAATRTGIQEAGTTRPSTGGATPSASGTARAGASPGTDLEEVIAIADRRLTLGVLIGVGALELAVHGWDLSRACGRREPIPGALATGLLDISPLLVPRTGRQPLFGPPVTVPPLAIPSDQLVAYLGRDPR
jgi:uncharacterized protein (TIGR03083 family)